MKINTKLNVKERWVKLEDDVEVLLRPFPFSMFDITKVDAVLWQQFDYCVKDWKGVEDDDGKEFKCNEANKKYVFDFVDDFRNPVVNEIVNLSNVVEERSKN